MLRIDVITIFPGLFDAFLGESIVGIAIRGSQLAVEIHDLRSYTTEHRHRDREVWRGPERRQTERRRHRQRRRLDFGEQRETILDTVEQRRRPGGREAIAGRVDGQQ